MEISFYGVFYITSAIFSFIYIFLYTKQKNLNFNFYIDLGLLTLIFGLLGSRLFGYFWFTIISKENLAINSFIKSTGFFYGGFIFSFLFLLIFCYFKNLNFLNILDIFSPAICLAQSIGRIGCYYAGCCFGKASNFHIFGFYIRRYPTQLMESIFCFFLFFYLYRKTKKIKYNGQIFFNYIFLYSIFRFFIEFLRGDFRGIFIFGLSISQIISVLILAVSIINFLKRKIY